MKSILSKDHVKSNIPETIPVVPTMDIVVFPDMIVPLLVLDPKIINGINSAVESSKLILLLASNKKTDNELDPIGTKDLYNVGTVASMPALKPTSPTETFTKKSSYCKGSASSTAHSGTSSICSL